MALTPLNQLLIPGGFRAATEQTAAVQALLQQQGKRSTVRKKARKKTAKKRAPQRRKVAKRASSGRKKTRLVKGSAAAKAHMAKLRKMRK
jgi:hypothetical protein